MEIKEIISELEYYRGYVPESAFKAAIEQKDEIIPELLSVARKCIYNIDYLLISLKNESYRNVFLLLAKFRVKEGFSLVTEFITYYDGDVYGIACDFITQHLSRVLASLFNGEFATIRAIVLDTGLYSFTRVAYLDVYYILYTHDQISRDDLLEYYRDIFKFLERKQTFLWERLIAYCQAIHAEELLPEIKQAYRDNLVDTFELPEADVIYSIENKSEVFMGQFELELIDDVIATARWYDNFRIPENRQYMDTMTARQRELIEELKYFHGYYPAKAIAEAKANQAEITPALLNILSWILDDIEELLFIDFTLPYFACYLLAEFEEKSAFIPIVKFVTTSFYSEGSYSEFILFLSEILASCYNGEPDILVENIMYGNNPEDVRTALMETFIVIFKNREIDRKPYVAILKQIFADLERESSFTWDKLIEACRAAHAWELSEEIEAAYMDELIDEWSNPFEVTMNEVRNYDISQQNLDWAHKFDGKIINTEWWRCFEFEEFEDIEYTYPERVEKIEYLEKKYLKLKSNNTLIADGVNPYVRSGEKIGRNNPCTCGSGKKYKKCCGKN